MNNKAIEAAIAGWFESNDGAYTKDPEFHARMQKAISAYHAALVEDEAMEAGHRPACYARECEVCGYTQGPHEWDVIRMTFSKSTLPRRPI